ncbi:MAG: hypothetical protein ACRYGA_04485 [Janthinobacterium lividum]
MLFGIRGLSRLSGGRRAADIVPLDFVGARYPEFAAPDLAGLSQDAGARPSAEDQRLWRTTFERRVLPGWIERRGPDRAQRWSRTIAPVAGVRASGRR